MRRAGWSQTPKDLATNLDRPTAGRVEVWEDAVSAPALPKNACWTRVLQECSTQVCIDLGEKQPLSIPMLRPPLRSDVRAEVVVPSRTRIQEIGAAVHFESVPARPREVDEYGTVVAQALQRWFGMRGGGLKRGAAVTSTVRPDRCFHAGSVKTREERQVEPTRL